MLSRTRLSFTITSRLSRRSSVEMTLLVSERIRGRRLWKRERVSLSGALPGVGGDSEGEEEDVEDENNFSVYECPGLAPTGDIEVRLSPSLSL